MPEKILATSIEIKLIVLMFLAWAARLSFRSGLTIGIIIRQLIISALVAYVAGEYVLSIDKDEWIKIFYFCCAVFLADDILLVIIGFAQYAKQNQETLFKRFLKK